MKPYLLLSFLSFCIGLTLTCLPVPSGAEEATAKAVTTPQQIQLNRAVEEIFGSALPENYQLRQGGPLSTPDGTQGFYLIMANPAAETMALIADLRQTGRNEGNLLRNGSMEAAAAYLFKHYIGTAQAFRIDVMDREKLRLESGKQRVAYLAVTFANGYTEPDLILRLDYPRNRTVVLMLGMPEAGMWKSRGHFDAAYRTMESEARTIVSHTTLSHDLLPSERYMLWRLREIFWP